MRLMQTCFDCSGSSVFGYFSPSKLKGGLPLLLLLLRLLDSGVVGDDSPVGTVDEVRKGPGER